MTQLIQPDLSAVGYPDYCLAYVEQVFGVKNDPDPDAWQGWLNTQSKHTDNPPSDVSVPVWFSWTGTIDGITQNWGHVAVSTPNGVYTNPLSGSGHNVYPSVQGLATAYGVEYVGWSEDIGNLKVIGDFMKADKDYVSWVFDSTCGRAPRADELSQFTGWDAAELFKSMYFSQEAIDYRTRTAQEASKVDSLTAANLKLTDQLTAVRDQATVPSPAPSDPDSVTVTKDGFWQALLRFLGKG